MDSLDFRLILRGYDYREQDYYDIDVDTDSDDKGLCLNPPDSDDESTPPSPALGP